MNALNRIVLYLRAAASLRSPLWLGLPLVPKSLYSGFPGNRAAYNSFILLIRQLGLSDARLIVDVGANCGDFALAASTCFPEAQIFVVEPLPKMQRLLQQAIQRGGKKWQLLPCALGAEPRKLPLFVDKERDDIGSLVGFSEEYLKVNSRAQPVSDVICEVRTLDAVAVEKSFEKIDLLKIDVEGFEFEVLRGAGQILRKTIAVLVEVSLVRKAGTSNQLVAMLDLLARNGFQIVNVIPSLFDPDQRWKATEFNILARRETPSP